MPDGAPAIINANGDAARYEAFDLPVVGDVVEGFRRELPQPPGARAGNRIGAGPVGGSRSHLGKGPFRRRETERSDSWGVERRALMDLEALSPSSMQQGACRRMGAFPLV